MKKFKFNLICIFILATTFQSCIDDMDVVSEDDDVLSSEVFYAQPGAYKQALAGVYGNLSLTGTGGSGSSFLQGIDAGTSQFGRCLWYLQNLTTDEVIWSYENDEGVRDLQRNTWTAQNPLLLGMFSRTMAEVALANEYLKQTSPEVVSGRGVTDATLLAEIEVYRNEARVLRAFAYYNLMDLFGKAPFITENDPLNFSGPQYDRTQLFEYIEAELLEVLPGLKAPRTNEYGRLDQAMARMILAKMYLNAEVYIQTDRYDDCITQCNEIIGSGYVLESNYLDNFNADNHTSTEMIFTLQSDGTYTQNYGATTVMVNGQVGEWENNGADFGVGGWGGALRLRKQFVQKFDGDQFETDDRKTIITGVEGDALKQRSIEITDIAVKTQGYILAKYSNKTSAGVPGPSSTFVDTDFPLFRLADAYLMYAEAQMRKDNGVANAQSVDYINALRERANGDNSANISSANIDLNFILDERSRELHWEGHRRQDLIRFGKFTGGSYNWAWKGNATNGISLPAYFSVFPLPAASISSNTNLTQNTGY